MLIFLHGPDTYRSQKKLENIIEVQKKINQRGFLLKLFEGGSFDLESLIAEVKTNSIFKEKKILIIKKASSDKKFKEDFLDRRKEIIKADAMVIFYEEAIDKRDRLFKFLKENSETEEFLFLEGEKLTAWLEKEIKNYGATIEPGALKKLVFFVGNDLWQMTGEIIKLVNYSDSKNIKEKDVDILVRSKIESDIFETINSFAEKQKDKALLLLHKHLEKGDSALYLLSMINFQFRNLLEIKDLMQKKMPYSDILKKSSLHPFVIRKTYQQAQKFSFAELKKIYRKIFQIDLAIKTGKIEPETAIDILVANL